MYIYDFCNGCEKWKFFVKKRVYSLSKKDLNGKIMIDEIITSKSKLCGKCYRNIKKMLNK